MQSVTDTKELIPEFFYLPEFLENTEGRSQRMNVLVKCVLQNQCFDNVVH